MGEGFRSGFVALLGRPNAGKSTLVNQMVGLEVSIATRKPQTTRHRILGIADGDGHQIVFVDTPGIHRARKNSPPALSRRLNKTAIAGAAGVDVALLLLTCGGWRDSDRRALQAAKESGAPVVLGINKIDRLRDKAQLLPLIEQSVRLFSFAEVVPLSALKRDNLERLRAVLVRQLPAAPRGFPRGQTSDRGRRFMAAEFLREQLINHLGQELPHVVAVEVRRCVEEGGALAVDAVVWVEKAGQKPIVLGKNGARIKSAGVRARKKMERRFGSHVRLNTWVKVKKNWTDDERALRSLGYAEHG